MHDAMTQRVMRAPVGWFEKTPLGRILNRFSSDIQEVDKDVMDALGSTLVCTFSALSIVAVISYTVSRALTCALGVGLTDGEQALMQEDKRLLLVLVGSFIRHRAPLLVPGAITTANNRL